MIFSNFNKSLIILLSSFFNLTFSNQFNIPKIQSNSISSTRGEQLYENLKVKIQYNKCWAEALQSLENGCQNMDDNEQRLVAYFFMLCHLDASGRKLSVDEDCGFYNHFRKSPSSEVQIVRSESDDHIKSEPPPVAAKLEDPLEPQNSDSKSNLKYCLAILSSSNFQIYTEFFTHVHDLCHHLQQAFWVKSTQATINNLSHQSNSLSSLLADSSKLALKTLEIQKSIDSYTEKLVESNNNYQSSLDELKDWIQSDIVNNLTEDIFKIYDIIQQNSEILNKLAYYILGFFGTIILTGLNKATKSCRFLCLAILMTCLISEYYFFYGRTNIDINDYQTINSNFLYHFLETYGTIYNLRKLTATLILSTIFYNLLTFKNMNVLNFEKLTKLENQINKIEKSVIKVVENQLQLQNQIKEETYKLDPDFCFDENDDDDSISESSNYELEISDGEVDYLQTNADIRSSPKINFVRKMAKF